MRPFTASCGLVVTKRSGGRWKYDLSLDAVAARVDDVIKVEATLKHTSSVAFRLTNNAPVPAAFRAYFTPESPLEMTVFPTEGTLSPLGGEGTMLTVSFTPKEYGKTRVGKLVVEVGACAARAGARLPFL